MPLRPYGFALISPSVSQSQNFSNLTIQKSKSKFKIEYQNLKLKF